MTFHSDWIRQMLYGSPTLQFLASLTLVAVLAVLFALVRSLRPLLGDRYTRNFAEAVEMAVLAAGVVTTAYLLADVWALSFVFDRLLNELLVDRWTGVRYAVSVAILVSGYLLIRTVNRSIDRLYRERVITNHQKEVAYHTADAGIFALAGLAVLSVWGIALTNVILGAGIVTAVFGLAAQKTVAALVSGFLLLFARPFRAGDWIEIVDDGSENSSGIVQDVTISHTKIRTFNDEHVLVPNDELTANELINYSRSDRLRIDVEVDVDYETDLERARDVVERAIEAVDLVSPIKEPRTVCKRFDDSAIVLELQFWIERPERRRVLRAQTEVIQAVKAAFDREGIIIPFPQRTHRPRGGGFRVETRGEPDEAAASYGSEADSGAEDD